MMLKWRRIICCAAIISLIFPLQSIAAAEEYDPQPIPWFDSYVTGDLEQDIRQADILLTWQMDNGSWYKFSHGEYDRPWNGEEPRSGMHQSNGTEIGTIDNKATTEEIIFLALMYRETGDERYKEAVIKGIDFLLTMQYPSGGWPQVFPRDGGYADYVTFNDDAMIRVMNLLTLFRDRQYPFDRLEDEDRRLKAEKALEAGLDYILQSQIVVDGQLTAWCAQHDPVTYEPKEGRGFEPPSISGNESVNIVKYLMTIEEPSDEIKRAIVGAVKYFKKVEWKNVRYVQADPNQAYFYGEEGEGTWFRFYEIGTNLPMFTTRLGVVHYTIFGLDQPNRDGYHWAGNWPSQIIDEVESMEYYAEVSRQLDIDAANYRRALREEREKQEQAMAEAASADSSGQVNAVETIEVNAAAPASNIRTEENSSSVSSLLIGILYLIGLIGVAVISFISGRKVRLK